MQKRDLSKKESAVLILSTAIIFGAIFRLLPVWMARFPINDGGMFYTMIQDLLSNHYIPPLYTSYNHTSIPFVYPPLGFYLGALLVDIFNLPSPIDVLQWLPAVLNTLCIPSFYFLAKELLEDEIQSSLAALVLAFTPHMTSWLSMGGGLTRALGTIFMLISLAYIYRVFAKEDTKAIWGAIIFGSLTTLSHTEAPVYTIAIAVYFWLVKSRSPKGILHGFTIALGVFVLAMPWYGWVVQKHGLSPLISAGQSGFHSLFAVLRIINIDFLTEEPYLGILGTLGVLGMASLIAGKNFLVPGMLLVIFLANPRSAHTIGNIPLAIAAGYFIGKILLPAIKTPHNNLKLSLSLALIVLLPYFFSNSIYYGLRLSEKHISTGELKAMQWVADNTPENSNFLVITGEQSLFCDSVSEWFPAITDRKSIATLQGNEWKKGKDFVKLIGAAQSMQSCLNKGLGCILEEGKNFPEGFSYLYVSRTPPTIDCNLTDTSGLTRSLILEIEQSPSFQSVFTSNAAAIFLKK